MKKGVKKVREPSLLSKIVQVYWDRAQMRKAERNLLKLTWSIDFLSEVVARASRIEGRQIELLIEDKDGRKIRVFAKDSVSKPEGSILDHLDDEEAVSSFIMSHSVR